MAWGKCLQESDQCSHVNSIIYLDMICYPCYTVLMYIDIVPNRNSPPAILLREGRREGGKVIKRTIANLSSLRIEQAEAMRRVLRGETLVSPDDLFDLKRTLPHGHVAAVLGAIRKLGLDKIISAKPCRESSLILAMIVQRIIAPCSKLEATRRWHSTTLTRELAIEGADADDCYAAMDWLVARQKRIEKKLAARHLREGAPVYYDVSNSYYEGRHCVLARFGNGKDGKRGKPIIVYGVLTDGEGRPIAVEVYPGNTGDSTTVPDQLGKLRERFGLRRVVLVGDRGMLTEPQLKKLREHPGLGWISALRSSAIRELVEQKYLQLSLFDQHDLVEIVSPDFPGERLVACFNPLLADDRRRKRDELLAATEKSLKRIVAEVTRRTKTPLTAAEIGRKVGRVIDRHKMGKHFAFEIGEGSFSFERKTEAIEREAALDGIYVVRTSEPARLLSAEDTVRGYKGLARVEQLFRTMKAVGLLIRPIRHREAERVRAHIFICMLAYYVEWQMRRDLAPLLFEDEELADDRRRRDPVKKAQPSKSAKKKKATKLTADGFTVHSFDSLMDELGTMAMNLCSFKPEYKRYAGRKPDATELPVERITSPTPHQQRAFELLGLKIS